MECGECGCSLPNERAKRAHERQCSGDSARARVEALLDDVDHDTSKGGVYVITVSHDDGEFYYVGESVCFRQRLLEHAAGQTNITVPVDDDQLTKTSDHRVTSVHRFEPVDGSKYVRKRREREVAYETAIETERTDILGNR